MPTIGTSSKPAYVYDAGTDTWIPIGPGEHTHDYVEKSTLTTTGDLVYASAANTPARLGIGSTGQVLTVSGGVPAWGAAGGKVLQIIQDTLTTEISSTSTAYADTGLEVSITPSSASSKVLVMANIQGVFKNSGSISAGVNLKVLRGATYVSGTEFNAYTGSSAINQIGSINYIHLDEPATTSATTYKVQYATNASGVIARINYDSGTFAPQSTIIVMEIGA